LRDGYDHLFVAGGDGTLNEVVNGVGATPGGFEGMTFGIIPLGTGNDFAAALGIPSEVEGALAVVTSSDSVAADVGRLNAVTSSTCPLVALLRKPLTPSIPG
jgi:diacylglycerol kinase (ATP)